MRALGQKDGRQVKLVRRTVSSGPGTFFKNMAAVTGIPFAALSRIVLDGKAGPEFRQGVFSPEAWVDVPTFYQYMGRYGVPEQELMAPIYQE